MTGIIYMHLEEEAKQVVDLQEDMYQEAQYIEAKMEALEKVEIQQEVEPAEAQAGMAAVAQETIVEASVEELDQDT